MIAYNRSGCISVVIIFVLCSAFFAISPGDVLCNGEERRYKSFRKLNVCSASVRNVLSGVCCALNGDRSFLWKDPEI